MEDFLLIEFKKELRRKILNIYFNKGYLHARNSTEMLIKNAGKKAKEKGDKSLTVQIRGECAEVLLELQIREFARTRGLNWFLSKGLTLERKDYKKGKTTELDLTLFTPSKIVLFESKYRSGKFKLLDECNLVPSGQFGYPANVYKQNLLHLDNLRRYLAPAVLDLKSGKPFSICLYMQDLKNIDDIREKKYKSLIPLLGPDNIQSYLENKAKEKVQIWDMQKIKHLVSLLDEKSDDNFKKHIKNIRGDKNG